MIIRSLGFVPNSLYAFTMKSLIIIGAGPGGYECAVRAAKSGLDVHVIDRENHLGGTCLCEGCIPTKCLCHSAETFEAAQAAQAYGVSVDTSNFDFKSVIDRKDHITTQLQEGIAQLMKTPGITFHAGYARFAPNDPHTVFINEEELHGDYIIIATGSVSKFLPIPGAHTPGVVTSTELLQMTEVPKRLGIIGGGVIGLEFASIFNTFGSQVTVIEYCKEILPNFDKDLAKRLRLALKKKGIEFITGAPVTAIHADEEQNGEMHVSYEYRSAVHDYLSDVVLMAVGRAPNLSTLNLEEAGIQSTPKGIIVNENMETNVAGVYAIGDINGLCQLAHAATFQGYKALSHLLGEENSTDLSLVPAAVFTTPEAAFVGLTEDAAKAKYGEIQVHKSYYRANGRAVSMDEGNEGFLKLLSLPDGQIIGGHILGAHAAEMIHEISAIMNLHGTTHQLKQMIHAHPTLSEIVLQSVSD